MKIAGSGWVETTDFHYIDGSNNEWYFTGTFISSPANAKPGSCWIDGQDFYYIDSAGAKRKFVGIFVNATTGKEGSIWVESTFFHWLSSIKDKIKGHADVAHTDTAGHTDTPHGDSG